MNLDIEEEFKAPKPVVDALNNPQPPEPVWVTTSEGNEYIPWHEWTRDWTDPADRKDKIGYKQGWQIHSVGFNNGWVFDNYGGWRTWNPAKYAPPVRESRAEVLLDLMAETNKRMLSQLEDLRKANEKVRESLAETRNMLRR